MSHQGRESVTGARDLERLLPLLLPEERSRLTGEHRDILKSEGWAPVACRRGLGAAFHVFLHQRNLWAELSGASKECLDQAYRNNLVCALARETVLGQLLDIFKPLEQEPILLKGLAFATQLYPEMAARQTGDIDLMVPLALRTEVDSRLGKAGFRLLTDGIPSPPGKLRALMRRGMPGHAEADENFGEAVYLTQLAGQDILIEIHYHLINLRAGGGKEEVFCSRSEVPPGTRRLRISAGEVLVLDPASSFLHALRHLALHHRLIGYRWHHDLALMLTHWEKQIDAAQMREKCQALRSEKILRVELALLKDMFGPGILSEAGWKQWETGALPWEYPLYRHVAKGGKRTPLRELVRTLLAPSLRRQVQTLT